MYYDLLLQPPPGQAHSPELLEPLLEARGGRRGTSGALDAVALPAGEIAVALVREGDRVLSTELKVPVVDRPALVREALSLAVALAEARGLTVFDPQLGRVVGAQDADSVAEQYQRTVRYAAEMMGLTQAWSESPAPTPALSLKPGTKVLLLMAGLVLLGFVLLDRLSRLPNGHEPLADPDGLQGAPARIRDQLMRARRPGMNEVPALAPADGGER